VRSCGVKLLNKGLAGYSAGLRNKVGGSYADGGRGQHRRQKHPSME